MDLLRRLLPMAVALVLVPAATAGGVFDTRHNLSRSSPGEVRASSETEVCIFCHAGHVDGGAGPLWNRSTSGAVGYQPYDSATLASRPGQPDGSTLLCLSCHDGTIAVGAVGNRVGEIQMVGIRDGKLGERETGLGMDLGGTHPVSIAYAEGRNRDINRGARTRLRVSPVEVGRRALVDGDGRVQCTSCHDAHEDPASTGQDVPPFWRGTTFDEVCTACHDAPLADAGHARADRLPEGCGSCHVGHGADRQPLLPAVEENACYACHGTTSDLEQARADGVVSRRSTPASVRALFQRPYRHPVEESTRLHQPGEDSRGSRRLTRHVECADCHPIHGAENAVTGNAVRSRGRAVGAVVDGRPEYELCYECHSTGADLPFGQTDKSIEFNPSNESYHPVEAPLGKRRVPSLMSPWMSGDMMTCGDCHGSDDDDDPAGPHGSRNAWILRDRYEAKDGNAESSTIYAACYGCHSRSSILSNESFEGHARHVTEERESCYACHDSHGVAEAPGLVRFGKDFRYTAVAPSSSGRLEYDPTGGGACYLSCHDVDHDPLGYP